VARFTIPRLVGKTNAGGLTTWYWQPSATLRARGWAPLRLGTSLTGSPPDDVVAAAKARNEKVDGAAELKPAELRRIQRPLTLRDAVKRWREAGFPSVKSPGTVVTPATARQYRSKCGTLEAWGGDVALTSITPQRVAVLRDALMQPAKAGRWQGEVRHHAAHETLRVGRTLFRFLEQQALIPKGSNPFTDFALAAPPPRQQIWWQPAREALLEQAAGDPALELAVDLAFSIGQREADLLRLQVNQYAEIPHYKLDPEVWEQLAEADATGRRCVMGIRLRQNKGRTWVEVPVVGATRRRIEAQIAAATEAGKVGVTMLLFDHESRRPWTQPNLVAGQRRFIRRFAELRTAAIAAATASGNGELAAELEQLQFRDFRRTAVVFLGELGIADQLIAAITGHSLDETKKILETYMPRTTGMAARAIALSHARAPAEPKQEQQQA
jgi:hypothetical protein